jgi:hypothetical protein
MPMPELPAYFVQQQDRILQDWQELSGEADASTGQAPAGVTAGTAINYLQEAANKFLTPQFQSIEFGWQRIARQTLGLFVQYVDLPRAIKTVGGRPGLRHRAARRQGRGRTAVTSVSRLARASPSPRRPTRRRSWICSPWAS